MVKQQSIKWGPSVYKNPKVAIERRVEVARRRTGTPPTLATPGVARPQQPSGMSTKTLRSTGPMLVIISVESSRRGRPRSLARSCCRRRS